MNSENQLDEQTFASHEIKDVDLNEFLLNNGSESESLEQDDVENHFTKDFNENKILVNNTGLDFESIDTDLGAEKDTCNDVDIMGSVFDNLDDAYTFYNRYALLHGFGIRTESIYKNRLTKEVYRKKYVCNKEGFKDNSSSGVVKKRQRDLRTGCEAMLRVSKSKDGKWFVDSFNDVHNHELSIKPTKVMKHRSHRKFHRSLACKSLMSEHGQSGLRSCQIKKVINTVKSPFETDVRSKQCADILSKQRKQYKGKEFYGLIRYLQDRSSIDSQQYWVVDLFDDGSPRNIFWADGRSRDAYIKFEDVVVSDVTYMKNRFKMPFSPFVGVNHHNQSILFGGALLENEKEETFEWLFQHFLKCMFDKYPTAIITDQDKATGNAIKNVFPNTRQRYCSWHIKKHELEHLRTIKTRYNDFEESYKPWKKSGSIEEFENRWEIICGKYDLESNNWIKEMNNQRHRWAKAFFQNVFVAGMTTSGRSDSIHSFFDGFENSKTMLNEFVVQFDKAVKCRRDAEEEEDFNTMNSRPSLSSVNPIESKAGSRYTRKMFDIFQKQLTEANNNLSHETLSKSVEDIKYKVGQMDIEKTHWRIVNFRLSNKVDVTCSCVMFETYGILCKHILYVLKKRHVETLPGHYILPRWTLDARNKVNNSRIGFEDIDNDNRVTALTLWCVQSNCTKAIEQARDSPSEIKKLNNILLHFVEEQMNRKNSAGNDIPSRDLDVGILQVNMMPQISIRDPSITTITKGRPKSSTRIKSSLEAPKKRTCSYCSGLGHYISGCRKKKADDASRKRKGRDDNIGS